MEQACYNIKHTLNFIASLDLDREVMLCTDGSGGESKNDLCTKSMAIIIITSVQIHYNNIIIVTLLALRWLTPPVAVVEVPAVLWPLVPPVVVVRPLFPPVVVVIVVQRRS